MAWAPAAFLLAGCGSLGFEAQIMDKDPFDPPAVYAEWWVQTESCADAAGDFQRVTWYLASGISGDGFVARGRWSPPHEIVLVRGYETDRKTVRHEILHDLLRGDREHASAAWTDCDLLFN